jgi:oligosaccharide repeat unit polymerase
MARSETLPYSGSSAATPARGSGPGIVTVQIAILALSVVVMLSPTSFVWKEQLLIYPCCVGVLLQACWALWSWRRLRGTLIDPYAFFFLSVLLFNGGLALLEVFGLNKEALTEGQFSPVVVARVLLLVNCGLSGLHCGALLAMRQNRGLRRPAPIASHSRARAVRTVGWTVFAVCAIPFMIQMKDAVSTVLSGGYLALFQKDVARAGVGSALVILADMVVPSACFLLAGNEGRKPVFIFAAGILISYATTLLFLGSRGVSVMSLMGAAWLWDRCVRRIPRLGVTAIAAIVLIVVFPLVRETRVAPGSERTSTSYLVSAYSSIDSPAVSMVAEMGKSMDTIAHTIELVPTQRPYDMGVGYAYAFLTVIPSLFWDRHPAVTRGIPGYWLIEMIDPYTAAQGGTIGFSCIAEAFLNFGAVGVPIVMMLIGYLFVRFCLWAEGNGDPARLAVVAIFVPNFLFFARGDLTDLPRALLWYGFAPYVAYLWLERTLRLREQPAATR